MGWRGQWRFLGGVIAGSNDIVGLLEIESGPFSSGKYAAKGSLNKKEEVHDVQG